MDDPIIKGIKEGKIYSGGCQPLQSAPNNLKFCPYRETCAVLQDYMKWVNEMEMLIWDMHCGFCESDEWIFIGMTEQGTLVTATMNEEMGKKVNEIKNETKE